MVREGSLFATHDSICPYHPPPPHSIRVKNTASRIYQNATRFLGPRNKIRNNLRAIERVLNGFTSYNKNVVLIAMSNALSKSKTTKFTRSRQLLFSKARKIYIRSSKIYVFTQPLTGLVKCPRLFIFIH